MCFPHFEQLKTLTNIREILVQGKKEDLYSYLEIYVYFFSFALHIIQ